MLMVLEMAPLMYGCAAAIMRMCDSHERYRLPVLPHLLAQSNTGRGSAFRCGAPSMVIVPHTYWFASATCCLLNPRCVSRSKVGSLSASAGTFSTFLMKSSPRVQVLNTN